MTGGQGTLPVLRVGFISLEVVFFLLWKASDFYVGFYWESGGEAFIPLLPAVYHRALCGRGFTWAHDVRLAQGCGLQRSERPVPDSDPPATHSGRAGPDQGPGSSLQSGSGSLVCWGLGDLEAAPGTF